MTVKTSEGTITAGKATLNLLTILAFESADKYAKENFPGLSNQARTIGNEIYQALRATGYYKEG